MRDYTYTLEMTLTLLIFVLGLVLRRRVPRLCLHPCLRRPKELGTFWSKLRFLQLKSFFVTRSLVRGIYMAARNMTNLSILSREAGA